MAYSEPLWGLPDPQTHSEFYSGTTTKRFFAWVVDAVIILLITIAILPFTAFIGIFFFAALLLLVSLVYRIATIAGGSATLGMRLMAIEMRTARGEKFDLGTATVHTLIYLLMMSIFVLQAVSIILMLVSDRGQGLHDMLLGTAAINRAREY